MNTDSSTPELIAPPAPVSFMQALALWFKLGFIGFGGPAAQISLMHRELVEQRRWISEKRFLHALNYCMLLPGPEAQQLATYMCWLLHKSKGGIAAGVLFVLPSLFFLITLSWLYIAYGHVALVAGLFYGIKPAITAAVVGVILNLAVFFAYHVLWPTGFKGSFDWIAACMAIVAAIALVRYKRNVIHVIAASAVIGLLLKTLAS